MSSTHGNGTSSSNQAWATASSWLSARRSHVLSRSPNAGTPAIHDANGEVLERRIATASFPYAVRYRVTNGQLLVMAVYHQRRPPNFEADRPL